MELKKKSTKIIVYGICIVVGIASLFPIYYTFINSIRDVYSTPATLLPKGLYLPKAVRLCTALLTI